MLWTLFWSTLALGCDIAESIVTAFFENCLDGVLIVFYEARIHFVIWYRFTSIFGYVWSLRWRCLLGPSFLDSRILWSDILSMWFLLGSGLRFHIPRHVDIAYFLLQIQLEPILVFARAMLILPLKFIFQIQMVYHRIVQIQVLQQEVGFWLITPAIEFSLELGFPAKSFPFDGVIGLSHCQLSSRMCLYLDELVDLGRQSLMHFLFRFLTTRLRMNKKLFIWVNDLWYSDLGFLQTLQTIRQNNRITIFIKMAFLVEIWGTGRPTWAEERETGVGPTLCCTFESAYLRNCAQVISVWHHEIRAKEDPQEVVDAHHHAHTVHYIRRLFEEILEIHLSILLDFEFLNE